MTNERILDKIEIDFTEEVEKLKRKQLKKLLKNVETSMKENKVVIVTFGEFYEHNYIILPLSSGYCVYKLNQFDEEFIKDNTEDVINELESLTLKYQLIE